MRAFATLDDADIKNKRVLVRVDLNVPVVGGKVTDRTRIERIAPTIIELVDKGGKVILLSHFGRRADTIPSSHSSCWPRRLRTS
jgi:phosphoglycerate kinase